MILSVKENDKSLNKKYNIEYYLGNPKYGNDRFKTCSGTLENIDESYFYFVDDNGGLIILDKSSIRTLVCIEK